MTQIIDFRTDPAQYRHWRATYHGDVANLIMDVDETAGLFEGYELKLNSYDLGVDIELNDIVQRMRFERPEVKVVVMQSGKEKSFAPEQIFACSVERPTATKSISANSPMKHATHMRRPRPIVAKNI
jgi:hypothetical protein